MRSPLLQLTIQCSLILMLGMSGRAEDLTFAKTRWSAPTEFDETDVALTLTDSAVKIVNAQRPPGRLPRLRSDAGKSVNLEIPYATITRISYAFTNRRRVLEGLVLTPLLMATKAQSHWLVIEHGPGTPPQVTLLRLDKTEYRGVISAMNARTGKQVQVLDPNSPVIDPTVGSHDMDEVVPFAHDQVVTALKASMEVFGCKLGTVTPQKIECRRGHGSTHRTGAGGEYVTATLEGQGPGTRVNIKTSQGFGRNWSTPIYREMRRRLEPAAAAPARPTGPGA